MRTIATFHIRYCPPGSKFDDHDQIEFRDKSVFDSFCRRYGARFFYNPNYALFEIDIHGVYCLDSALREIYELVGKRPAMSLKEWHRERNTRKVFTYHIKRECSKRDILDAPLLELWVNGAGSIIAEFRGMKGDESVKAHGGPTVPKKGREFGFIDGQWPALAVTDGLKDKLLAAHLKGLEFREVELDKPAKDGVRLWQPWSPLRMPRSKLDLYSGEGADFVEGSYENGCFLDDGPYQPPLFRYDRKSLEALPPFDIAMTHERTGAWGDCLRHTIISQRFRQVLASHKVKGVSYKPVILD